MAENMFNWQFNTIPGNANQGAILLTRNDLGQPPFNQSDFIWKAMEDVIGTADIKLEYDESTNIYTLSKAKGHQDNEGNWTYEWEVVGTWDALTDEVVQLLRDLKYVTYRFDEQTVDNITTLTMYGVKKDGTEDLITTITFVQKAYVDQAIANIKNILVQTPLTSTDSGNNRTIGLKYDTDDFQVDATDGLQVKGLHIRWQYAGEVQDKTALPDLASQGIVFGVINEADLYVNLNNENQPANWYPFTYIAESFNAYGIELHKGTNGMYGKLRYDTIDFTIDNLNNLKAQIIDDSMGGSDPNANRKTYSIEKILQLLSSAMKYMGQVPTYNDLPTNLTPDNAGYTYNVVDTGDNYAWNGTGWDKLAGDYIAGAGIVINGKTISATGISFQVGQGLEATGAGSTTNLHTKNGNGIEYDTNNAIQVKQGSGITVNAAGVNVNTGYSIKLSNNNLEVDYGQGLGLDANNKLIIPANFNVKTTPLGTESSKLALYSDGKIAVDFETDPVVLTGELLKEVLMAAGTNSTSNTNIPNLDTYDMFYIDRIVYIPSTQQYIDVGGQYIQKGNNGMNIGIALPAVTHLDETPPRGLDFGMIKMMNVDFTNNTVGSISVWTITSIGQNVNWNAWNSTASQLNGIRIYGIKAR